MSQFGYAVDLWWGEFCIYADNALDHHRITLKERTIKSRLCFDYKRHATGQRSRSKTDMRISAYLTYTVMGDHMLVS